MLEKSQLYRSAFEILMVFVQKLSSFISLERVFNRWTFDVVSHTYFISQFQNSEELVSSDSAVASVPER